MVRHTATSVVTIERFIIEQERQHPEATGELSGILYDIALAAKMIASKVRMAGLADILGSAESQNIQGEVQQKLDVVSNEIIIKAMDHTALRPALGASLGLARSPLEISMKTIMLTWRSPTHRQPQSLSCSAMGMEHLGRRRPSLLGTILGS